MHLVFATSIVPDGQPATGYEIANAAIIASLRRAGARVTVIGFTWPGSVPADPENTVVLGSVDVRTDNATAAQKAEWVFQAIRTGTTFSSVKLRAISESDLRRALETIGPFDAYILNAVQLAGAFETVFAEKPSLFVAHNVEHLSAEENARAARSFGKKMLFQRESRLLKAMEERLCRRAQFVFTLAEEDRAALGVADDRRSVVLPLTTPAAVAAPAGKRTIECDAALIGTWTWAPNRIGLDWFFEDVVPHLPEDFRIRVAGAIPADLKPPPACVELVGRVPDATEFVRQAAVIPLIGRAGTGVQLKTIETFELGLPTVATSSSLRGIGHRPVNCVVADDARRFAAALVDAARNGVADVDGSAFARAQAALLDSGVRRGLSVLLQPDRAAAA